MAEAAEDLYEEKSEEQIQRELEDRLEAFGNSLVSTRTKAIAARNTSGIEDIWREDEEFYEGIDDLNRGDERTISRYKPTASNQSSTRKLRSARSRVFPNITGPFVDAASARISDMLLPTDDRPWEIKPTPIPELAELADQYQMEQPEQAKEYQKKGLLTSIREGISSMMSANTEASNDAMVPMEGKTPEDAYKEVQVARQKAEATQTRIEDWHVQCQWHAEVRKVIEDSAKVGVGILKGPVPKNKKTFGWQPGGTEIDETGEEVEVPGQIAVRNDISPGSKRIDYWNFFPHGACGQNIQNGAYVWERDYMTKKQVRDLLDDESYVRSMLLKCLEEGPKRASVANTRADSGELETDLENSDKYEVWFFTGTAEKENLEAAGCDCEGREDPHMNCVVTIINDHVVKANLPALDYGGFPYDVFTWRERSNYWAGIGVARQIRTAQKIVVGATRTMMDNAGLAGGPMIVFDQKRVTPADGVAGIGPRKVFYITGDEAAIADATKAIGSIKVDMMVNEMMVIIKFGLELAEHTTGLPMLLQGQQGQAPDTVGGMTMLNNNANSTLRRLARLFDDKITEPHLRRYYIWHLQYGPDNEKGDYQVDARGSTALVERDIQNQQLMQMYSIVIDPRIGLDPKKWGQEIMKSLRFDPARLEIDDDEWGQMLQNWQQMMQSAGQDSSIQVAQIREAGATQRKEMDLNFQGEKVAATLQSGAQQKDLDRQAQMISKAIDKELNIFKEQGATKRELDNIKARLSEAVMKINSTFALANMEASADRLPKPPFEPPGRAEPGNSYQQ